MVNRSKVAVSQFLCDALYFILLTTYYNAMGTSMLKVYVFLNIKFNRTNMG